MCLSHVEAEGSDTFRAADQSCGACQRRLLRAKAMNARASAKNRFQLSGDFHSMVV